MVGWACACASVETPRVSEPCKEESARSLVLPVLLSRTRLETKVASPVGPVGLLRRGLAKDDLSPVVVALSEDLRVMKLPLPSLEDRSSEVEEATRAAMDTFEDNTLSSASAAFISFQPLSAALARTPLQVVLAFLSFSFLLLGVIFVLEISSVQDFFKPGLWIYSYRLRIVNGCVMIIVAASIMVAIAVGRNTKARYGIRLLGVIAFGLCIDWGIQSIFLFTYPDVLLGCTYGSFSVAFALNSWVFLFRETAWTYAFILSFFFSVPISFLCIVERGVYVIGACSALPGTIALVGSLVFLKRRRAAIEKALRLAKPGWLKYDLAWKAIALDEYVDLVELSSAVRQYRGERKLQPSRSLLRIYRLGSALDAWFQDVARSWAEHCGAVHMAGRIKSPDRALQKLYRTYHGRVPPLLDILRSTIVVDRVCEAHRVLNVAIANSTVHDIKNRFDVDYTAEETNGYRDLNLHLSFPETVGTPFEGFVFELQIHLRVIFDFKTDEGHRRYIELRNLRGD